MSLNLTEKLAICEKCLNRKINPQTGLVCKITDEKPTFETSCPYFQLDSQVDFQQRMLAEREEKKRQQNRKILRFFVLILPVLLLFIFGGRWGILEWQQYRFEKKAEALALQLEDDLSSEKGELFKASLDVYQLLTRTSIDSRLIAQMAHDYREQIRSEILFHLNYDNPNDNSVKLVRTEKSNGAILATYRIYSPLGILNFFELEIREIDNRPKIVNGLHFGYGSRFNQIIQDLMPKKSNGGFELPYYPGSTYRSSLRSLLVFRRSYDLDAMATTMKRFSPSDLENRVVLFVALSVYKNLDSLRMISLADRLLQFSKKESRSQSFIRFIKSIYHGSLQDLETNYRHFQETANNDPVCSLMLSYGYQIRHQLDKSCSNLEAISGKVKKMMDYRYLRITCLAHQGKINEALKESVRLNKDFRLGILYWEAFFREMPNILESREFEVFLRKMRPEEEYE